MLSEWLNEWYRGSLHSPVIAFCFHDINFSTKWPSPVNFLFRHHPRYVKKELVNTTCSGDFRSKQGSARIPNRTVQCVTHQIAGHNQSPRGNLARTSILPYVILCFPLVDNRALLMGLIIAPVVMLLTRTQSAESSAVQTPCCVRFKV